MRITPTNAAAWQPPDGWSVVRTVDLHTAGEPFRVIVSGFPDLPGSTMLERRRFAEANCERWRTLLMREPRGHADMYGCIVTPPVSAAADCGVLFVHNAGYSTMCGHGVIGLVTAVFETGMANAGTDEPELRIDSPAGLIAARATMRSGRVTRVAFRNVPSFVASLDADVEVPGVGAVRYDLAYGGAFYAYVSAEQVGLRCVPEMTTALIHTGMAIKHAVMNSGPVRHPFEPDLGFLYGTIFTGPPGSGAAHSRHVCIFADGEVDRSPTGTGVSGRLALLHARGELEAGVRIEIESILGTSFGGKVVEAVEFGPHPAIIPEVDGCAFITGRHEFLVNPDDPLQSGFLLPR